MAKERRAPRNRTIVLTEKDRLLYRQRLKEIHSAVKLPEVLDSTICQDTFEVLDFLPSQAFDLIFADPPYNLTKTFNRSTFNQVDIEEYEKWLETWVSRLPRLLKSEASLYLCGDWRSSAAIHRTLSKYFKIQNCIVWEREKGRGAKNNWKNNCEDIWFATVSDAYVFNVDAVKLKRRVIAPYTDSEGRPKDWQETGKGRYRITYPSNIWTDLTAPFWSMPENTDHPTQKPEKLLAKVILASSNKGDTVLDPFLGSGTTSVVARKLHRHYVGIEIDSDYCCLAEKRLDLVDSHSTIQGYANQVFWERNTLAAQDNGHSRRKSDKGQGSLFTKHGIAR